MWTCPNCRQRFYNTNQSHSCGNYTVDKFLQGKSEKVIELFHFFLSEYKTIGAFELHPVKTRVALLTKMRFCSINRLGKNFMSGHLILTASHNRSCFYKIDNLQNRFFVHHFKLRNKEELNDDLKTCMKEAYDVGQRKHIRLT
jgi:hypothetical protein